MVEIPEDMGALSGSRASTEPCGLGPLGFDPERIDGVIAQLCEMDRDLLLGRCEGWGSWMFASGGFMVSLGLGTKRDGNIRFDTPLAKATIARLNAIAAAARERGDAKQAPSEGPQSGAESASPDPHTDNHP